MNLLITGGAGFIGSNFIHYILKKYPDYQVVNLDKVTYCGNLDNLREVEQNPRYKFIKGDICERSLVEEIFRTEKPEVVVNFAAATHVDRSILEPEVFTQTNLVGTQVLLETARKFGLERFLQISTDEVYGTIQDGKSHEMDPFSPNSPYAATKAAADLLTKVYYKTFGMPASIARSCNNFGPYQHPEKLIPLFVTNILEDKKVPLYGSGLNVRDWIYVEDNCSAIDCVLQEGRPGEAYNIGANNEKNNLELTEIILQELGKDEQWIEYVADRPSHDFRYALNTEKIKSLGWQPRYDFSEALQKTIAWYKENPWWWKKIKSGEYLKYYKKQYLKRS